MKRVAMVGDAAAVERIRTLAAGLELETVAATSAADAPADAGVLVVGDPVKVEPADNLFHVVRATVPDEIVVELLRALATGKPSGSMPGAEPPRDPIEARRAQQAFAASRRIAAASDATMTERLAIDAIVELCDVERAYCLFFDAHDASLWSEALLHGPGDDRRATAGLAGWAARTGCAALVPRAGDDARWLAAIDDPDGDAGSEVIVQPVFGGDGHVHAVLVGARRPRTTRLGEREASQLRRYATLIGPLLDQLSQHVGVQELASEVEGQALFRREAIEAAGPRQWGDVVRVSPSWLSWSYWVLVVLLGAAIAFMWFASVSTYSSGPALIRSTSRSSVTARTSGNVTSVDVMPGDQVEIGTVIARLDDIDQRAAVERIRREFDTQLRNHMVDPSDATADASLRSLRLDLERARNALAERAVVAPLAGTVSDLRVRPGQQVEPGDVAASIVDGSSTLELIALLPGEDRPQLAPGMQLRLEIDGYRYAYQSLVIESVSSDVIAPSEARRVLGAEVAEGLRMGGSVVLVRGRLPGDGFQVDGRAFRYHDGMRGTAEVRVRTERVVFALVPGLRRL